MTASAHKQAFLQTVCERPKDDTPRLVFADWLDEHDNGHNGYADRAEFIRLQCEGNRLKECNPLRTIFKHRANELLKKHRNEWTESLCTIVPRLKASVDSIRFERGFPNSVTLGSVDELDYVSQLRANAPLLEMHLTLPANSLGEKGARQLARDLALEHLTHLHLFSDNIGSTGAQALAQSPLVSNLIYLDLIWTNIGDRGLEALAHSPRLDHLMHLDLSNNYIGSAGVATLAQSSQLCNLTYLGLCGNRIGDVGARALAQSPHLAHLKYLDLRNAAIGNIGAAALSEALQNGVFPHLTELYLEDNFIDNTDLLATIHQSVSRNRLTCAGRI